jgi:hypothetical protein
MAAEVVGRGVTCRRAAGVNVGGAGEVQDADELNLSTATSLRPPADGVVRCRTHPGTITHSHRRVPTHTGALPTPNILSTTLPPPDH